MTIVLSLLLIISLVINGIFFWYTRKIVFNLSKAVDGMDEMQKLFTDVLIKVGKKRRLNKASQNEI